MTQPAVPLQSSSFSQTPPSGLIGGGAASLASGRMNATGLCVRSLLDDTPLPSNFGLVGRDDAPRGSFYALRDAIRAVRWNA